RQETDPMLHPRQLPAPVLVKLRTLETAVEDLSLRVSKTIDGINKARNRLTGSFRSDKEYKDMKVSLDDLIEDRGILERHLAVAQTTLSSCNAWLNGLDNAEVELVEVNAEGDLDDVVGRIKDTKDELAALRSVPTPAPDIRKRIEAYVREMAQPKITGIGKGEELKVVWPGAEWDRVNIVPMIAFLHGEAMISALMRQVDRMVNEPMPAAARRQRIAELE